MALEIERRFFVASETWQELSIKQEQLDQGYLSAKAKRRWWCGCAAAKSKPG